MAAGSARAADSTAVDLLAPPGATPVALGDGTPTFTETPLASQEALRQLLTRARTARNRFTVCHFYQLSSLGVASHPLGCATPVPALVLALLAIVQLQGARSPTHAHAFAGAAFAHLPPRGCVHSGALPRVRNLSPTPQQGVAPGGQPRGA